MTHETIDAALNEWRRHQQAIERATLALYELTGAGPDCNLLAPVFALWEAYTTTVSAAVGDTQGWLQWFEHECRMGRSPMDVRLPDGRDVVVDSLHKLALVIAAGA